ncbi:MAG: hypothetical protein JW910_22685 [Anaerolineae bacterium]|nr:hypothetical protein [Anaerolineae bacterium]
MGFMDQSSLGKPTPATVLVEGFQLQGTLNVMGILHNFLNEEQKAVFLLADVTAHGVTSGHPAASMAIPELYIRKDHCHVLAFNTTFSRDDMGLMPHAVRLALYTSLYAIQGDFHMGPEDFLGDFIDVAKAMFVGVTDAAIFPLFRSQAAVIAQAPLVYINRRTICMHHPV